MAQRSSRRQQMCGTLPSGRSLAVTSSIGATLKEGYNYNYFIIGLDLF